MAIDFNPKAGMILYCDFRGYVKPEIIKSRPVIIVTPNIIKRSRLVTVVPLSTTAPNPKQGYHLEIENTIKKDGSKHWVKCDMLATVRFDRLDRVKVSKRNYQTLYVSNEELMQIKKCIALSLGIDN